MSRPDRCIDPVIKYCQECKYGLVKYPEWVETYEDTFDCTFEVSCMYGLENTEPTYEEVEEFEKWYSEMKKWSIENADCPDFGVTDNN